MQQIIARSKGRLETFSFQNKTVGSSVLLASDVVKQSRFSFNGKRLAVGLGTEILVFEFPEKGEMTELCRIAVCCNDFVLSPSGRYLATFEKPNNSVDKQHFNLAVWKLQDGQAVTLGSFSHKTQSTWIPQWTGDESHFGRMTSSEVQFYRAESLEKVAFRIRLENIGAFAISPSSYPKVAVFIKEAKGMPGAVKVFLLPNTAAPVAQKMFFKADRCTIQWSANGRHVLAMSQTEIDSSGVSYYGETNLYFVSGDGSFDCRVELDKEGPIHDFAWSPQSNEFVVLYGYMPSKAMLFDMKCNAVFEFPVGSKNHVRWNPQGSLICFGGFGNLAGHVEIWSRKESIRRISNLQSQGSSICEWAPDGATIITATLTPRLRVDNGFRVWSWDGSLLSTISYNELYSVSWRSMDSNLFPSIDLGQIPMTKTGRPLESEVVVKKEVYRPPGLRNLSLNAKANPAVSQVKPTLSDERSSTLTREERQVKRLKEKLDQIQQLKDKSRAGGQLELNQVEKLKKEDAIRKQYEEAVISLRSLDIVKTW